MEIEKLRSRIHRLELSDFDYGYIIGQLAAVEETIKGIIEQLNDLEVGQGK